MTEKPKIIIGFKIASDETMLRRYLVTLEIPLENNNHKMNRPDIVDRNFAKMRCQRAKVLNIEPFLQ